MTVDGRRRPGWYPDQDDPAQVRYFTGRGWSDRHRSLPAWAYSDIDVEPDASWGSLQPVAGGPVLEGPVRPAPLPATARGALIQGRSAVRTERLVRPPGGAGRASGGGVLIAGRRHQTPPGWVPARRPLMLFCALVGVAVVLMAGTVVGIGRSINGSSSVLGHDIGFVTRATSICQAGLRSQHTPEPASMTAPGDTRTAVTDAEGSSTAVAAVEQQLRSVPVSAAAASTVGDWLDDLGRYVTDERQLALTLGAGRVASPPGAGRTPAEMTALHVTADITQADLFADANSLSACDLAPSGGSPLVSIP